MFKFLKDFFKVSRVILVILLISVVTLSYYLYTIYKKTVSPADLSLSIPAPSTPPGLIKAPTPYLILPTGKQTYLVQTNRKAGDALLKQIIADPIEGPTGSQQTIGVEIEHNVPIVSVKLELTTDNETNTYELKPTGDEKTKGIWEGTWTMSDSHKNIYYGTFIVVDEKKHVTKVEFPIR